MTETVTPVICYEGGVEPEVERNIFIPFWQTLEQKMKTKDEGNQEYTYIYIYIFIYV